MNYPVKKIGPMRVTISAKNMQATNLNLNLHELDIQFLEEETMSDPTQPSFIVNGITVNPTSDDGDGDGDVDRGTSPLLPLVSVIMPTIHTWSISADLNFDFTLFSIETSINLTLGNITSSFTAAMASSDNGKLMPIISSIDYNIGQKTLDITNNYWLGWIAAFILNFSEKMTNIIVSQFGLPVANIALPSIIQALIDYQVLRIPVSIPYLSYYDQFYLDYSFTAKPAYVPDSLEFYVLGDIYQRN